MKTNALLKAQSLQQRLLTEGFVWRDRAGYIDKVREEIEEIATAELQGDLHDEIGDLLLACTALSTVSGVNPACALNDAIEKFSLRYDHWIARSGEQLLDPDSQEGRSLWAECKKHTRASTVVSRSRHGCIVVAGAWDEDDQRVLATARDVGKTIASLGAILVTGGGPGVMLEATCAAHEMGGLTVGVLGTEDPKSEGAFDETSIVIPTGLGWDVRSSLMMRMASAIVVVGGAVGTLQEITMAYMKKIPIIVMECGTAMEERLKSFCLDGLWIDHRRLIPLQFCSGLAALRSALLAET